MPTEASPAAAATPNRTRLGAPHRKAASRVATNAPLIRMITAVVVPLHRGDRAPRALRTLAVGPLDPLLELVKMLIDQLRARRGPIGQCPRVAGRHVAGDGAVRDPASSPASRNDPVKSNASNMFMITSADFTVSLLGRYAHHHRKPHPRRGLNRGKRRGRRRRVGQIS